MYSREAHSLFVDANPDINIRFSAFAKLKPKNVLLLKNTSLDQCRCETHENFIFKLTALKFVMMITFGPSNCVIMHFHQTVGQSNVRTVSKAKNRLINKT